MLCNSSLRSQSCGGDEWERRVFHRRNKILTFNERGIYTFKTFAYYIKVQWLRLFPTRMKLTLHCNGELKLTNRRNRRRRKPKKEERNVPTNPS